MFFVVYSVSTISIMGLKYQWAGPQTLQLRRMRMFSLFEFDIAYLYSTTFGT